MKNKLIINILLTLILAVIVIASPANAIDSGNSIETAKDELVKKQYNIKQSNEKSYPIKYFPNDKITIPFRASLSTHIKWIDNSTILYLQEKSKNNPDQINLVKMNIESFNIIKIDSSQEVRPVCYDVLTKKLAYLSEVEKGIAKQSKIWKWKVGTLGNKISEITKTGKEDDFFNENICNFQNRIKIDGLGYTILKKGFGKIAHLKKENGETVRGGYRHISENNVTKDIQTNENSIFPIFQFDTTKNLYWNFSENIISKTSNQNNVTFEYFDKNFNLVSRKTLPKGPWPISGNYYPVKGGYLVYKPHYTKKSYLYFLKNNGQIVELIRDYGLQNGFSVSLDGCKALFLHSEQPQKYNSTTTLSLINLCLGE